MRFGTALVVEAAGKRGQDRAVILPHSEGIVLAVADGAGGSSGGEEAAETLMMWVRAYVERTGKLDDPQEWVELLGRVDGQINCATGETTGVVAAWTRAGIAGASVGDSGAWMVGPQNVYVLTEGQARKPLIGSGLARPAGFRYAAELGTLLMGSDGLFNYAPRAELARVAERVDLNEAAREAVNLTRLKSGGLQDDISVIMCRPGAEPGRVDECERFSLGF